MSVLDEYLVPEYENMAECGVYSLGSAAFSFFLLCVFVCVCVCERWCESVCKPVCRGVVFDLFVSHVDE